MTDFTAMRNKILSMKNRGERIVYYTGTLASHAAVIDNDVRKAHEAFVKWCHFVSEKKQFHFVQKRVNEQGEPSAFEYIAIRNY